MSTVSGVIKPEAQTLSGRSALLPLGHEGYTVRPLRHWGAADREHLAAALARITQVWASRWPSYTRALPPPAAMLPSAQEASEAVADDPQLSGLRWSALHPDGIGDVWWALLRAPASKVRSSGLEPRAALLGMLFGEPETLRHGASEERVADQLADLAWSDLRAALALELEVPVPAVISVTPRRDVPRTAVAEAKLPQAVLRTWDGSLLIQVPWCGAVLVLLVSGDVVAHWLEVNLPPQSETPHLALNTNAPADHPVAVLEALGDARVALELRLATLEVPLGTLAALRVGDILCTTHDLEAPLQVHAKTNASASDGMPLCDAFLGRQGSRRAIELLPPGRTEPAPFPGTP